MRRRFVMSNRTVTRSEKESFQLSVPMGNKDDLPGSLPDKEVRKTSNKPEPLPHNATSNRKATVDSDSPVLFTKERVLDFEENNKAAAENYDTTLKKNSFQNFRFVGDENDFDDGFPPIYNLRQPYIKIAQVPSSLDVIQRTHHQLPPDVQLSTSSFDLSSDRVLLNLQGLNSFAHDSFNEELAQTTENSKEESFIALKNLNEIEQLKAELNALKLALKRSENKSMDHVKCSCCAASMKCNPSLHSKVEHLESNNLKSRKLIEFNQENDGLKKDVEMGHLVSDLQSGNRKLKRDLEKKQQHLDRIVKKLEIMQQIYDLVKQKLEDSGLEKRAEHESLINENSELTIELDCVNEHLAQLKAEHVDCKEVISKLNEENKKMASDIVSSQQDQTKLEVQLDQVSSQLSKVLAMKSKIKNDFEELCREYNENQTFHIKQFDNFNIKVTDYQNKIKLLRQEISELTVSNEHFPGNI